MLRVTEKSWLYRHMIPTITVKPQMMKREIYFGILNTLYSIDCLFPITFPAQRSMRRINTILIIAYRTNSIIITWLLATSSKALLAAAASFMGYSFENVN